MFVIVVIVWCFLVVRICVKKGLKFEDKCVFWMCLLLCYVGGLYIINILDCINIMNYLFGFGY